MIKIIFAILMLCFSGINAAPLSEDERIEILQSLDWKWEGTHELPKSNSSITIPEGFIAVIGEDAYIARRLDGDIPDEDLEAAIYTDGDDQDVITFESNNDGFVTLEDWGDVDADDLLKSISDNTEIANASRAELGVSPLHVTGWLQKPTLDPNTNTVYWAIEGMDEELGSFVNAIALRLGRNGFERVVWATGKDNYTPLGGKLDLMLRSHSYDPGFTYADHTNNDKLAGYGIAALVAAVTGGNIAKAGGFVALLALLKKGGALIIAALGALAYHLKSFFSKKKEKEKV